MAEEFSKEDLELARESVFELCRRANARGGNSSAYQEYNQQLEGHVLDVIDRPVRPADIAITCMTYRTMRADLTIPND